MNNILKIYDTHCHPYLQKDKKISDIFDNFKNSSGVFLNSVWVDIETSIKSIELSKKNDFVYATVWVHPCDIIKYKDDLKWTIKKLENLYLENKENLVAIWECWLDYHWLESMSKKSLLDIGKIKQLQKVFFEAQIKLAKKLWLWIIIHNRGSKEDVLEILKELNFKDFIFHCYSEDLNYAKKLIGFSPNCKISFSWIVTFKNAASCLETAKYIALKNIIIETDAPYLTPVPLRGKEENEPELIRHILEKIIEVRNENRQDIESQIFENSLEVFWFKKA